jgi:hypothetical protein
MNPLPAINRDMAKDKAEMSAVGMSAACSEAGFKLISF